MPGWAKVIAYINPVTWFIEIMRLVVLKGSGFSDIKFPFLVTCIFAVVLNGWAIFKL
jgi:ABC-2 type transport system permease protein